MIKRPKKLFRYVGGKALAADIIWKELGGGITYYCEPFFGSGDVWFLSPYWQSQTAILNDLNGNLVNFWRSVQKDPEKIIDWVVRPRSSIDYTACRIFDSDNQKVAEKLAQDIDYYDSEAAAKWLYAVSGSFSCINSIRPKGMLKMTRTYHSITSFNEKESVEHAKQELRELIKYYKDRLLKCEILCQDWKFATNVKIKLDVKSSVYGFFLDPPYTDRGHRYAKQDTPQQDVLDWCVSNGDKSDYRIVVAGFDGEYEPLLPLGWRKIHWSKKDPRETLYVSPNCENP